MKSPGIAIILEKMKPKKKEEKLEDIKSPEEGPSEECIEAAIAILDAIASKDPELLAQALLDFEELKESYPEDESEEY